jgi:hypothetical protein
MSGAVAAAATSTALRRPGSLRCRYEDHAAEAIEPVLRAGHRDFGENRVQEAQGKDGPTAAALS